MILDRLENHDRYTSLHPGFAAAFEALAKPDFASWPDGRHVLQDDRLFVLLSHEPGRGRTAARLEAHRKYIDIQYVLQGVDLIGWKPLGTCQTIETPHDPGRDVGFFGDASDAWISLPANTFVVFFPGDAHAPLAGEGPLHKAVVKILVDW